MKAWAMSRCKCGMCISVWRCARTQVADSGSELTPAPYEKAQTSEEKIYMQAVRSSRQLSTEVPYIAAPISKLHRYTRG